MATQDFTMTEGDTKLIDVNVKDPNTGDPTNVSGSTISWKVFKGYGKTAVLTKTTASGISITDGANGVFRITITAGDTANFYGTYNHEAQVTFSDTTVQTVVRGTMTVEQGFI